MATLARLAHEKFTDPAIGRLLDELRPYEESLPYDSDDASLIRVTRRDVRARRQGARRPSWRSCRRTQRRVLPGLDRGPPGQRFRAVQPYLEKTLDLSRAVGRLLPRLRAHRRPADRFRRLRHEGRHGARRCSPSCATQLVPLVQAITAQPPADDCVPAASTIPKRQQLAFGLRGHPALRLRFRARAAGQDPPSVHDQVLARRCAHHHARQRARPGRVRCSARMHEAGHAMYEQGIDPAYEGTPLAQRHLVGRAREPVAPVGEPRRAQPGLLGVLLPAAAGGLPGAVGAVSRSTPSTARSTRSSAR